MRVVIYDVGLDIRLVRCEGDQIKLWSELWVIRHEDGNK